MRSFQVLGVFLAFVFNASSSPEFILHRFTKNDQRRTCWTAFVVRLLLDKCQRCWYEAMVRRVSVGDDSLCNVRVGTKCQRRCSGSIDGGPQASPCSRPTVVGVVGGGSWLKVFGRRSPSPE